MQDMRGQEEAKLQRAHCFEKAYARKARQYKVGDKEGAGGETVAR